MTGSSFEPAWLEHSRRGRWQTHSGCRLGTHGARARPAGVSCMLWLVSAKARAGIGRAGRSLAGLNTACDDMRTAAYVWLTQHVIPAPHVAAHRWCRCTRV